MKRKFKFTITKIRSQTTNGGAFHFRAVCPVCKAETDMPITTESIVFLEGERTMPSNPIADAKIHRVPTDTDPMRICAHSIMHKGEL